eukprot:13225167-Alexandrium_andersonii.AAC.1
MPRPSDAGSAADADRRAAARADPQPGVCGQVPGHGRQSQALRGPLNDPSKLSLSGAEGERLLGRGP